MKVALVHDWLTGYRGGERVLHHLARRFPEADLYTLIHDRGSLPSEIEDRRIVTSPLDALPGSQRHYRKLLPLFPWAIRRFDLHGYDLILSTSHAVAKSVAVPDGVPHLSYCFTPMRYVWDQREAYLGRGARRWLTAPAIRALRRFDVATSGPEAVSHFVAISTEVADRIGRHYGRFAPVVPPPVDVSWIRMAEAPPEDFYLLVSGFVPYKQDRLALEAFRQTGRRLVVVGDGPGRRALAREAPPNVSFLGRIDDESLAELYRQARALVYPQREDFGLIAVEAQAAGRPVIAYGAGGVLDTVRPLLSGANEAVKTDVRLEAPAEAGLEVGLARPPAATGVFFAQQTPESLIAAIEDFERAEATFEPSRLRAWAEQFSPDRFDRAIGREIEVACERVATGVTETAAPKAARLRGPVAGRRRSPVA